MPAFDSWDIVKVPFPYTDRPVRQRRPALVIAANGIQERHGLLWVLMITSTENRGWPGDVEIADLSMAGLPVPSVIRTVKIATIAAKDAERIGSLESEARLRVRQLLLTELASAAN